MSQPGQPPIGEQHLRVRGSTSTSRTGNRMGNGEFTPDPDKTYGPRYAISADDDLYGIAGRILSDLKSDQSGVGLPPQATVGVAVNGTRIIVHVFVPSNESLRTIGYRVIRTMVFRAAERYNWRLKADRRMARYDVTCHVSASSNKLDGAGFIIG